jgi:hypothetical protein
MAACSLAVGVTLIGTPRLAEGSEPVVNRVQLTLEIAGLSQGKCEVEIKPGHPACQFTKVVKQVGEKGAEVRTDGKLTLELAPMTAQTTHADRDCAFAITIKEPGQPARTYHRGVRLTPRVAGGPVPVQQLTWYLSSPSLANRDEDQKKPRR